MAVLGTNNLTLLDWTKRVDPDGNVPIIGELLSQKNEVLMDMVWREGNLPTGHREIIRTGLPDVTWRALNQGVPNSKSTTAQIDEGCAILETRSELDKDIALLNGNSAQFRLSEDSAFIEAMNQKMASTIWYGDPGVDPKQFLGMRARYNALTGSGNSTNVLSAGGTALNALTSIYIIGWGDQTVFGCFPKGSKAGLVMDDLGEQTVYNGDLRMQALTTRYQWKCGMVFKDWRYGVRICNIDPATFTSLTGVAAPTGLSNLLHLMVQGIYKLPDSNANIAIYCNRTVHAALSRIAMEKQLGVLTIEQGLNTFGRPHSWMSFMGYPIRCTDSIVNTEAQVL